MAGQGLVIGVKPMEDKDVGVGVVLHECLSVGTVWYHTWPLPVNLA